MFLVEKFIKKKLNIHIYNSNKYIYWYGNSRINVQIYKFVFFTHRAAMQKKRFLTIIIY